MKASLFKIFSILCILLLTACSSADPIGGNKKEMSPGESGLSSEPGPKTFNQFHNDWTY